MYSVASIDTKGNVAWTAYQTLTAAYNFAERQTARSNGWAEIYFNGKRLKSAKRGRVLATNAQCGLYD